MVRLDKKYFSNPIIARETIDILRKPRSFFILFFLLLLISVFLVFSWPNAGVNANSNEAAVKIFRVFGVAQLVLLPLFTCLITSQCLTSERENGTLEILSTTVLSPSSIILGKMFSNMAFAMLMSIATLPILSMCFQLGGVGADEIIGIYAGSFKYVVILTSLGIVCSALMKKTLISTGSSLVISLIVLGWAGSNALSRPDYFQITNHLNIFFLAPASVFTALFIILATKSMNPENSDKQDIDDSKSLNTLLVKFDENNFPDNLLAAAPFPEGKNPVFDKELSSGEVIGKNNYIRFFLVASMFVAAFLLISSFTGDGAGSSGTVIFYTYILFFTGIITPSLAGNSMAKEIQARTYDVLCTTPIKYSSIISGKVKASLFYTLMLVFIVFAPCSLGAFVSGQYAFGTLMKFGLSLIAFNIMEALLAVNISIRSKNMAKTSFITMIIIVILLVLPPMTFWYFGDNITSELSLAEDAGIFESARVGLLKAFLCLSPGSWVVTEYKLLKASSIQNSLFTWNLVLNIILSLLFYADSVKKGYFRED